MLPQWEIFNIEEDNISKNMTTMRLINGKKRSMSLWVEYVTASGYLSAQKIRNRLFALVDEALKRETYRLVLKKFLTIEEIFYRCYYTEKFFFEICIYECIVTSQSTSNAKRALTV